MVLNLYKPFYVVEGSQPNIYKLRTPYISMDTKLKKVRDKLVNIDMDEPVFKDSLTYEGNCWRNAEECSVYPIQRKLTTRECVFDFDNISASKMYEICIWMKESCFKFEAWLSSPTGLHIHFWSDIVTKDRKKILTELMSEKVFEKFGVENDIGPMSHGFIRTEGSRHPRKGYEKILFMSNIGRVFPVNELDGLTKKKVADMGLTSNGKDTSNAGERQGKCRTCMKMILDGTFDDCRKRLMFTVASHYIATGQTKTEAVESTWTWAQRQGGIGKNEVVASVYSTSGKVGCYTRHNLLEEVGIGIEDCKWE